MKAAILEKLNSPLVIADIEIPELGIGQVLVEVMSAGICGAQISEITGAKGEDKFLPHLLGHEGAGVVADTGPGVKHVEKGNHVVMHWRKGAGIDADFPKYKWGDKTVGGGQVTTFSEYAVVSENRLTPINKDIGFDVAALMGCSVTTGLGIIHNEAFLEMGQSIAVIGCGGVGLNVIQGARMVSASPIIAIDDYSNKLDIAEKYGSTMTVFAGNNDYVKDNSVDVVVDTTGIPVAIEHGISKVAPGGKMVLVGQPKHGSKLEINNFRDFFQGKTIMDSQGGLTNPTEDIPRYLDLYKKDYLKLDDLITHTFPLDQINEAIGVMKSGKAIKCIMRMK